MLEMSQEIVKLDVKNTISMKHSSDIKQELQDEYYSDNKVCVSETSVTDTVNITNTELDQYIKDDKARKYEILSVDHVKTDLLSSEVNDTVSDTIKIEDVICPADVEIKFCNALLVCSHCHEVYQDYCTKCRVLVHILNEIPCHNRYNRIRELPKCMLETRESIAELGIFSLKVIPEDVRFGPFTGLNSTELPLRIKGGKFVIGDDKSEHLNWMQYINPARNNCEQNLFPMQYEDKLYYCSTRRIQKGEELLVYFGKEYDNNLLKNMEMDFLPITKKDVENIFACIFCCLGFRSKEYLAEHKAVCHSAINEMFSVEELVQCPVCKIYLEAKEYFEHHKDYCCDANIRHWVHHPLKVSEMKVERHSFEKRKTKIWRYRIYKCNQCKFTTVYNADFRHHANVHYQVKMYKCEICPRRYKAKKSLKVHMKENHVKNIKDRSSHPHDGGKQCQFSKSKFHTRSTCHPQSQIKHLNKCKYKCANCGFKTSYRTYLERHMNLNHPMERNYQRTECQFQEHDKSSLEEHIKTKHMKQNIYKCVECEYKTNIKAYLRKHINGKHLKQDAYKCTECEYKTSYKLCLEVHIKKEHLKQEDYKCTECEYKTNYKSHLKTHIKAKHLKEIYYKCTECAFETNYKSSLETHIKAKHLNQNDYKCMDCEYKTNYKSHLKVHVQAKHLKENEYKCIECEFKTNYKWHLKEHIKTKHLKQHNYKCTECECEYVTNRKSSLEKHIKAKHLKQKDYKCTECDYKTNYKSSLKVHKNAKHLKEHDYKCAECEFKTNYRSHVKEHIRTQHLKEHCYKCTECECGYMTNRKSDLEKHIKAKHLKQNDYKCTECDFKIHYKVGLDIHIKANHLKENDYKCTECEFETNSKLYLEKHIKAKHLKQKDYKCIKCEYKTSYKSNLERHMKRKHHNEIQWNLS